MTFHTVCTLKGSSCIHSRVVSKSVSPATALNQCSTHTLHSLVENARKGVVSHVLVVSELVAVDPVHLVPHAHDVGLVARELPARQQPCRDRVICKLSSFHSKHVFLAVARRSNKSTRKLLKG